jgi:hypothetical protein
MHPLVTELSTLKDSEVESKINDLTKKYFMTYNVEVRMQIASVLDVYKEELEQRRNKLWQAQYENRDKGLDKLINVS